MEGRHRVPARGQGLSVGSGLGSAGAVLAVGWAGKLSWVCRSRATGGSGEVGEKCCTSHVRWRKSSVSARDSLGHTQHPRGAGSLRLEMRRERQRKGDGKHRLEITDLEKETGPRWPLGHCPSHWWFKTGISVQKSFLLSSLNIETSFSHKPGCHTLSSTREGRYVPGDHLNECGQLHLRSKVAPGFGEKIDWSISVSSQRYWESEVVGLSKTPGINHVSNTLKSQVGKWWSSPA